MFKFVAILSCLVAIGLAMPAVELGQPIAGPESAQDGPAVLLVAADNADAEDLVGAESAHHRGGGYGGYGGGFGGGYGGGYGGGFGGGYGGGFGGGYGGGYGGGFGGGYGGHGGYGGFGGNRYGHYG